MQNFQRMERYIRQYKLVKFYEVEHNTNLLPLHIYNLIDSLFGSIPSKSNTRPKFINYYKDSKVIFGHENNIGVYISDHILKTTSGGSELIIILIELLYEIKFIYLIETQFKENY